VRPYVKSPDEPEGGWLGPRGGNGFPDLEELDRKQAGPDADRLAYCQKNTCHKHRRCMYLNHPQGCKQ
jgi:hypothetical protein